MSIPRNGLDVEKGRPLLHHLNADSSWLLQIPIPSVHSPSNTKRYFNILIDPWLQGPQSDVASWFSQQWHATSSAMRDINEVEQLALRTESESYNPGESSVIDAVAISHEFTDHCHRETLLELSPTVPVFAPDNAAALIKSWDHFQTVIETPLFSNTTSDWRRLSSGPLPAWVAIARMVDPGNALYYHSAITVVFDSPHLKDVGTISPANTASGHQDRTTDENLDTAECIVYTPHGIAPAALTPISHASPRIRTLCLLHGMHDVSLYPLQQLNLGGHNGLQVQRLLTPKYWVGTHDEIKKGGGLVSYFLTRKVIGLKDALEREKTNVKVSDVGIDGKQVHFVEVENGQSITLE